MTPILTPDDLAQFRAFGFVVLRGAFDPAPLAAEVNRAMAQDFRAPFKADVGGGELAGHYVPMMCERTPVSLALLDAFAPLAARLLGGPVLPVRAKSVRYFGATAWHRDSERPVASVGFAAYLERLRADNGALRVLPGSHETALGAATAAELAARQQGSATAALSGSALETDPGDVIIFDEHLFHASTGGHNRRQWRVDYVRDPIGNTEEASTRDYFRGVYAPDWDGGYDVDLFSSYGKHWLESGRPWVDRLRQLGVYEAAAAEETFARSRYS